MTTVLVPLDGSELAQRAVPFATTITEQDGRTLLLLRAVNTLAAVTPREAQAMLERRHNRTGGIRCRAPRGERAD